MAIFRGSVYSRCLDMRTDLTVMLPSDSEPTPPQGIVFLLHGLSDNSHCWEERTMLPIFAEENNVAVIMPEVQRSWYADLASGPQYFSYVSTELPELAKKLFGLSFPREQTAVMGLSMGGYGALKCGLTFPERFGVCCGFSSACDVWKDRETHHNTQLRREMDTLLSDGSVTQEKADLFVLAEKAIEKGEVPHIYTTCGRQDSLYDMNIRLKDHLARLGYANVYEEWEGDHNWYFWNESLGRALDRFFPAQRKA